MAAFHGKTGAVVFNDVGILNVTSWNANASCPVDETTAMNNTDGAKTYLAGYLNWTATVEGILEDDDDEIGGSPNIEDADATLNLAAHAGLSYEGDAIITGVSYNVDRKGVEKLTYSFQGTGALLETVST